MKQFMRKINDWAEYIQLCPTGAKRSKTAIKNRHIDTIDQSGLTGKKLIDFIISFVAKKRFLEENYDAILIEDDKDWRFLSTQENGTAHIDIKEWERFKREISEQIHARCPDIPIVFFYAAPEVEAWFLSDWHNSFSKAYKDEFTTAQNEYFQVRFRKYINDVILTRHYKNCIEEYGFFDHEYKKLSEQISLRTAFWRFRH